MSDSKRRDPLPEPVDAELEHVHVLEFSEEEELLATESIGRAVRQALQGLPGGPKGSVAGEMAVTVVVALELIDIDKDRGTNANGSIDAVGLRSEEKGGVSGKAVSVRGACEGVKTHGSMKLVVQPGEIKLLLAGAQAERTGA